MDRKIDFADKFNTYYCDGYNGWMMNVKSSHTYRFHWAISNMKKNRKHILNSLEIACASGDFTQRILKSFPSIKSLKCVDICEQAVEICGKRIKNNKATFEVKSLPKMDYESKSFDAIWCMDVIYYLDIKERIESVKEINRLLEPNGIALFMIPYNLADYSSIRRCVKKYMEIVDEQYNYNGLWNDCTVWLEKKYKCTSSGIIGKIKSKFYLCLLKSKAIMLFFHILNMLCFKKHISHYLIMAKKR